MAGRNYSSHKFSQVLRKDGTLDVDKLARECSRDVFEDKRHRRVDDMKKKAIGTSRDYDEFRNFVHCAEDMLEPVSSREMEELKRGRTGWAHTAAARATRRDRTAGAAGARFEPRRRAVLEDAPDATTRPPPATPLELDRDWRRCRVRPGPKRTAVAALAETRRRREKYLARHGPTVLAPLLASELDATLVAEVLDTVCRPWVEAVPAAAPPPPPPAGGGGGGAAAGTASTQGRQTVSRTSATSVASSSDARSGARTVGPCLARYFSRRRRVSASAATAVRFGPGRTRQRRQSRSSSSGVAGGGRVVASGASSRTARRRGSNRAPAAPAVRSRRVARAAAVCAQPVLPRLSSSISRDDTGSSMSSAQCTKLRNSS